MARLLLVRHGETDWGKDGRYQGHDNTGLNTTGQEQADRLRKRLSSTRLDAIYSSDLARASKTASIIASEHGLEIIPDNRLREINFGQFEGMGFKDMRTYYPNGLQAFLSDNPETKIPGGESLSQLMTRVAYFGSELEQDNSKDTVLIVAHGGSLRALLCDLLGMGPEHWWRMRLDNTSLTVVQTSPKDNILYTLNDTCHLRDSI